MRKQKITTKHIERTYDYITVPEIRLAGKWLMKLGFKEGDEVIIQEEETRLVICLKGSIK